jgi:ferredoxin
VKLLRRAKENLFFIFVAAAYAVMFILKPGMGIASVKNSAYYVKEMILIMPVIFVLTALLDLWVPKERIMKYLGREAGAKGAVFSLVLGSISAGPIYAAFPLCVMLHKKGASVRNLVIILSAWAVIKVPMRLNEMKFLGFRFMAIRWVLTVAAILIFSLITAHIVKDGDLPRQEEARTGLFIHQSACIGCALCVKTYPERFEMQNKKALVKQSGQDPDRERLMRAVSACPVKAITYTEET